MIENIRKYTGLMIVIFVILFISFFFMDSSAMRSMGSGQAVIKVDGRTYDETEFRALGSSGLKLASGLAQQEYDLGLRMSVSLLQWGATSNEDAPEKFFVGRMIVRGAKEDFGIYPGQDEITGYLKGLRAFAGPDGKFEPETYQRFVDRALGSMGLTEKDLRELASDILTQQKLASIVGAGLNADRDTVARQLALQSQQITGEVAKLELKPFEEKIQPTEEEVKAYWETVSDAFTTRPKRKFTYIIASPVVSGENAEEADKPETIVDAVATDEAKKAAAAKKEKDKTDRAAKRAEELRKAQLATNEAVDNFYVQLEDQDGAGFEDLAKANNWEVQTTDFFPVDEPPKGLDVAMRATSRGGKAVDELFKIEETTDPFSKFSEPVPVGENQWLIARLDGEEKSRTKTYEEAHDETRNQYISEKAAEAMKKAAEEAAEKIRTAVADGKSFAEAAKDAGLGEVKTFTDITSSYRPDEATEPKNLFDAAHTVAPGAIADPIIEPDSAFIVHVEKREVVKPAIAEPKIDGEVASLTRQNETIAFISWLANRTQAAQVQELYKR